MTGTELCLICAHVLDEHNPQTWACEIEGCPCDLFEEVDQ